MSDKTTTRTGIEVEWQSPGAQYVSHLSLPTIESALAVRDALNELLVPWEEAQAVETIELVRARRGDDA